MNDCLTNIVTVNDKAASLSGYDLFDAPEITTEGLNSMNTSKYEDGLQLAKEKVLAAILELRNDFIALLASNRVAVEMIQPEYNTSKFYPDNIKLPNGKERGVIIYKTKTIRGRLRKLKISHVDIYPLDDVEVTNLVIEDNGLIYKYPVQLVANKINTFWVDFVVQGAFAKVTLESTDVAMSSAGMICNCDGTLPEGMGQVEGWDGIMKIKKEGFGINLRFKYFCDYEQLLCDLSKTYVGELLYLKSRILVLEEHIKSNRFSNWVVYGKVDAKEAKEELEGKYVERWNTFVNSLFNILSSIKDECLNCKGGITWHVNT